MEDDERAAIEGGRRLWERWQNRSDRLPEDLPMSPIAVERLIRQHDATHQQPKSPLSPETQQRIDEVLDRFAASRYLSDAELDEIRNGETIERIGPLQHPGTPPFHTI